jgi:hypothetical protein
MILSEEKLEEFKNMYPCHTNRDLAEHFQCSVSCVKRMGYSLGLKKTARYFGRFQKGCVPHNSGKKIYEYMSSEGILKSSQTRFHAVHEPGTVIESANGYYKIKTLYGWELLHRYIWRQAHPGETIGKRDLIVFVDGNRKNLSSDNIIKSSIKEILSKYGWSDEDKELFKALYSDCSVPLKRIASRFGINSSTVVYHAKRLNVVRYRKPKPEKVKLPKPEKVSLPKPEKVRLPKPEKSKQPVTAVSPLRAAVPPGRVKLNFDEKKVAREDAVRMLDTVKEREDDKIAVRIDNKTVIMIHRDENRETAIKRYLEKKRKAEKNALKGNNGILVNVLNNK